MNVIVALVLAVVAVVLHVHVCQAILTAESTASFKPYEVLVEISDQYGLDKYELINAMGRDKVYGRKAKNTPLVAIVLNVSEIFKKDCCMYRYLCGVGTTMRYYKRHIHPTLFNSVRDGDDDMGALIHGIQTGKCRSNYGHQCEMTLNAPFNSWAGPERANCRH